ncbi:hypothetical protein KDA08_04170 [Candidatus Saccharibacteria bacterium]|nr:hypothetical protein [Candidatus Saccharibacteria bacterium]
MYKVFALDDKNEVFWSYEDSDLQKALSRVKEMTEKAKSVVVRVINEPSIKATMIAVGNTKVEEVKVEEVFDFDDGNGPVPAKRHKNPDGSIGGWVANTAQVVPTAFVGKNAVVFGYAKVSGKARVYEGARVYDCAEIYENAQVYGYARVHGKARIHADAQVYGTACVRGYAYIGMSGNIRDDVTVT